jgi:Ca-activated chloride channel family protein
MIRLTIDCGLTGCPTRADFTSRVLPTAPLRYTSMGPSRLCTWIAGFAICLGQAPAPFRVDVKLVNVSFAVRDSRGVLVPNLERDDFDVFEDGVPQKISFFARTTDLPLSLGLIVDASGSQEHFVKQHHHDLEKFLKNTLTPRDRAFLLCFGNRLRLVSDYSPEPKQLMDALHDFEKDKGEFPLLGPPERRILGTAFYDALFYPISERLQSADNGSKALIVFSDGEDNSSAHHMLDAIEAAQSADVRIFALRYTEIEHGRLNARNKYGMSVMARLARETGGADFDAREKDLATHFKEIGDDLRSSYGLAYHSTNTGREASFHNIVIKPKPPGLTVRAKTGYSTH